MSKLEEAEKARREAEEAEELKRQEAEDKEREGIHSTQVTHTGNSLEGDLGRNSLPIVMNFSLS